MDPDGVYPDPEQGDYPEKKMADNNDVKIQEADDDGGDYFDDDIEENKVKVTSHGSSASLRNMDKTQSSGVGQTNGGYMAEVGY